MNYIQEIKSFNDWLIINPSVSSDDIVLWYALMNLNNISGWQTEFTVAISTIIDRTRLSRSAIYRSRNRLVQMGRIKTKERSGNQCSIYELLPFVSPNDTHKGTHNGTQVGTQTPIMQTVSHNGTQTGTQVGTQHGTQAGTIIQTKLNETKQEQKSGETPPPITPLPPVKKRIRVFDAPTLDDVKAYFSEKGYSEQAAIKAFNYYDAGDWKDSEGKPVKNWKQKMIGVWFNDENKANKNHVALSQNYFEQRKKDEERLKKKLENNANGQQAK